QSLERGRPPRRAIAAPCARAASPHSASAEAALAGKGRIRSQIRQGSGAPPHRALGRTSLIARGLALLTLLPLEREPLLLGDVGGAGHGHEVDHLLLSGRE